MKLSLFIAELKKVERQGAKEIRFSNDEEGNNIMNCCSFGIEPEIYNEGNVLTIYPFNKE